MGPWVVRVGWVLNTFSMLGAMYVCECMGVRMSVENAWFALYVNA